MGWHQGEVNKQCLFPPQERFEGGPCWDSIAERLKLRLRLNPLNVKVECVYIPKFCYLKVNKIRPDKPITVPAQGYFNINPPLLFITNTALEMDQTCPFICFIYVFFDMTT